MPAVKRNAMTRLMWRSHRWIYRVSNGRLGAKVGKHAVLQLTTTGRKSGEPRSVLLTYLKDDGDYTVVASYAGEDRHPAWWLNLLADPAATVAVRGKQHSVTAAAAEGERREALWRRFNDEVDAAYQVYQDRTERDIPVVVLTPTGSE